MQEILIVIICIVVIALIVKTFGYGQKKDDYNRSTAHYNRNPQGYNKGDNRQEIKPTKEKDLKNKKKKPGIFNRLFNPQPLFRFDDQSINWCAHFLNIGEKDLTLILTDTSACYKQFKMMKRNGGCRMISAPTSQLLAIQRTIYQRILLPVSIHPASTGFRHGVSIVNNAKPHLGKKNILKADIKDFFGSIRQRTVIETFEKIGYPSNIAEVLAELCCLGKRLPQGAATSPALSNIIVYEMDKNLTTLSKEYQLIYTRYADDLTFSGNDVPAETLLPKIDTIVRQEKLVLQNKKTRFITEHGRKIITGVSISSGEKLTIPKSKKRKLRKNIYYIRAKGLAEHQRYIGSTDPAYLQRLIGQLSYWLSIEPNNQYAKKSITYLKELQQ